MKYYCRATAEGHIVPAEWKEEKTPVRKLRAADTVKIRAGRRIMRLPHDVVHVIRPQGLSGAIDECTDCARRREVHIYNVIGAKA